MSASQLALTLPMEAKTYGRIRREGDAWIISDCEPHVAIRLKQLFPRIPKTDPGPWTIKRTPETDTDLAWFMSRYPLGLEDADRLKMAEGKRDYFAVQAEMERIFLPNYQMTQLAGFRPGFAMRRYQQEAVELAYHSRGLLIGDEVGLGKTWMALGFCMMPGALPAAVVCQVHIQKQWCKFIRQFTTLRVHAIRGTRPYSLPAADVYVFRYSQVSGWTDIFNNGLFKTAIFDELQELRKGRGTSKGAGAAILADKADYRIGLTATPIYNYGNEIYNVMRFIGEDVFGPWEDFAREYLGYGQSLKDPKAVGTYLRDKHVFLRRTKADVGQEMPAVNRIVDVIDYDDDAIQDVEKIAHQLAIKATRGAFVERGNAVRELDLLVRQATGVSKAKHVAAIVRILVESGEPVLLVGWHRAVYEIWLKELSDLDPLMYTGTESGSQKNKAVEQFIRGESNLLIMSLRSGAGVDGLQARCSTVVFGELDWSPGVHHQVIGRLDREGQTSPVTALFLVVEEGSDPPMMEVLGLKASEAHQVIDPLSAAPTVASDRSHLQALVQRYLKRDKAA